MLGTVHTAPVVLPDRVAVAEIGWAVLGWHARQGTPLSLVYVMPDGIGRVQRERGPEAVAATVEAVGEALRAALGGTGTVGRWSDTALLALLPDTGIVAASLAAEHALALLGRTSSGVTAIIGVAEACEGESWGEFVERAEYAMERSRRAGGNRVTAAPPPRSHAGCESIVAGRMHLVWRSAYASGHPVIDAQHRRLFELANEVLARSSRGYEAVRPAIDSLLRHCANHFRDEERILAAAGYPDSEAHARSHRHLAERADALRAQCDDDLVDLATLLAFIVRDVVAMHVLREDRAYFPRLSATG